MKRRGKLAVASAILLLAACQRGPGEAESNTSGTAAGAGGAGLVERGRYLVSIMDCAGCHNRGSFSPKPDEGYLEGGTIGFEVPGLGVFYPPNLTPHPDASVGRWSEAQIVTAVRTGVRPDGRVLSPAMPWRAYATLTDEDAAALAAYLKSLPPSANTVPGPATKETAPQPYLSAVPPTSQAREGT